MAKDGEKAEISINQESYFSTQQGSSSGSSSTQLVFSQNIQKVEAGISMTLTPTIRGDYVTVHIDKAEVSENIKTIDQTNNPTNNPYPVINRRRVNTTVEVPNGKTFVIGGLSQKETFYRTSRIPYLGRAPYLGRLFQTIEKQEYNAEVVIFISPRIIREPVSEHGTIPGAKQSLEGSPQTPTPVEPILIPPPSPSAKMNQRNFVEQASGHSRL
jgi:type II secretory pathway component GspD/PulD (secretin)